MLGNTAVALLHFVVPLIATVMARSLVFESLGLPPQGFGIAVGFLIVALYIPALMAFPSIVLLFFGLVMVAVGFIKAMTVNSIQMLAPLIGSSRPKKSPVPPQLQCSIRLVH
ncbi:MAG: hypothetical protein EOO38_06870 [Cytophagaceae bacterium]|nr:MAG: hypothetical protein EOO38_06870 [Cytophagaceae bacterium]